MTVRDSCGKTAIHYCVSQSSAELIDELVASCDDSLSVLEMADNNGHRPLHAAVIAGNADGVEYLLNHGADINSRDNEQHSAAHWAVGLFN